MCVLLLELLNTGYTGHASKRLAHFLVPVTVITHHRILHCETLNRDETRDKYAHPSALPTTTARGAHTKALIVPLCLLSIFLILRITSDRLIANK